MPIKHIFCHTFFHKFVHDICQPSCSKVAAPGANDRVGGPTDSLGIGADPPLFVKGSNAEIVSNRLKLSDIIKTDHLKSPEVVSNHGVMV